MVLDLDVAWLVGCSGLVFLMQPGFMCLESGLTRSKNNINVAVKNLTDFALSVMVFWLFGYSLMFGQTLWGWIGGGEFIPELADSARLAAFFLFQAMFCGTATTIVSGAVSERMRYKLYLFVCLIISGLIYPVFGHWAWNGIEANLAGGWLRALGFVDFAGSTVVHSIGAWVALAALLVVGPRRGRFSRDGSFDQQINRSNLPFSVLGAMLLWLGWLGFNGGSTLAFTDQIPRIIVQTIIAGVTGLLSATALGWHRRKLPEVETIINGSLAGLVSITAGCNAFSTGHAVLVGAIGGLVMMLATDLMEHFHIDDGVDAVAVHGFCGAWGTLAVALFGDLEAIGTGLSRYQQLEVQLLGVGVAFVWAFGLSYLIFKGMNRWSRLRVSVEEEELGLNVSEHGAKTEFYELFRVMDVQATEQDYSLRVPITPYTVVGKIAHRYNQVMDTVESYANQLHDFNAQLEDKVAQRTAELAEANDELVRLSRVKDRFLANTSHELRTPLHGIVGLAEAMLDGATGEVPAEQRQNLIMIAQSGRRLTNLVNDILDSSQLQRNKIRLDFAALNLRSVVDLILTMSEVTIGKKEVALLNAVPPAMDVWADVNRLQQILYNLIGNGIKFTLSGHVKVSAVQQGDGTVAVAIADTGIGIPADQFGQIFESFEQADGSASRSYGGTGLGLSVTQQLVKLHGGQISVTSELEQGSTFTFTLWASDAIGRPGVASPHEAEAEATVFSADSPVEAVASTPLSLDASSAKQRAPMAQRFHPQRLPNLLSAAPQQPVLPAGQSEEELDRQRDEGSGEPDAERHSEQSQSRRFKVLIVDDEPVNLQVLVNQLKLENYSITQASSGVEALDKMEQGLKPDLILLDVMMPEMTGYEVCQRLRERFPANELPILMLTAKSQIADIVEGLEEGANDYLSKPIRKQELLARMRTHLYLSNLNVAYSRFVPREFLRLLDKESILDVQPGDQVLQEMSILFSDIRDFTSLSERMTPQDNFRFINRYLSHMEPAITENQGFIDKYIGDAIMALFGGSADDAVRAAIAMLQRLTAYNKERVSKDRESLRIGIGINTGNLMLGTVGGTNRIDSTVIGDVVNIASRLEGLTKVYQVPLLISEFTLGRLERTDNYYLRLVDRVQVKGRTEWVSVYEVFDADPQELREQKARMKPHLETAIAFYQRQDYAAAQEEFEAYLALMPGDPVAQIYAARCREQAQKQ